MKINKHDVINRISFLARTNLFHILDSDIIKEELDHINIQNIEIKQYVYAQLKGNYDCDVFICKLTLTFMNEYIGYYEYIADEKFNFIDEFFVLK